MLGIDWIAVAILGAAGAWKAFRWWKPSLAKKVENAKALEEREFIRRLMEVTDLDKIDPFKKR